MLREVKGSNIIIILDTFLISSIHSILLTRSLYDLYMTTKRLTLDDIL